MFSNLKLPFVVFSLSGELTRTVLPAHMLNWFLYTKKVN